MGDGMLHAVYFRDGRAHYTCRWVRTDAFVREEAAGEAVWPGLAGPFNFDLPGGPIKDNSNTDIIFYAGENAELVVSRRGFRIKLIRIPWRRLVLRISVVSCGASFPPIRKLIRTPVS